MNYRRLGDSGLWLSEIGLGTWLRDPDSLRLLVKAALKLGINHFDTADSYGNEEALGNALKDVPRSEYVIATKAYWPTGEGPNSKGLSRKHLIEACNASLKRLGLEYVDIFYCHRYDKETLLPETLDTLNDLVRHGKVLYIGASQWPRQAVEDAIKIMGLGMRWAPLTAYQGRYNLLDREIENVGLLTSFVAYSPLAQGVLTGKYLDKTPPDSRHEIHPDYMERYASKDEEVRRYVNLAREHGITPSQLAIAWLLSKNVSSVLVGAKNIAQLSENVKAIGVRGEWLESL